MNDRIPLWVDLAGVPAQERDAYHAAAQDTGCERVFEQQPDIPIHRIANGADQQAAMEAIGPIIVDAEDWTIIPLENLIAARRDQPGTLYAVATTPEEAMRFRDTLEVGVHGIVLRPETPSAIAATDQLLRQRGPRDDDSASNLASVPQLTTARITRIEDAGTGERVCVDCTERFQPGEGLLVGSTARSFVLVHAETIQSEFVEPRPFRVNAGAIHSYLYGPDGRTQYLSEVAAGTNVLAVHANGTERPLVVGRAKIEHRPHTLIAWRTEEGNEGSAILQTAETIRLIRPDGQAIAITDIQIGDSVQVHNETAARHFGMPVHERLVEQ